MIKILHVDDNEDERYLASMQLRKIEKNVQIDWASSGREALKRIGSERFDCILCDFQMPGMDGLQVLHALRENEVEVPFIFLTGQGNEELAAEALRAGADDYFTKEIGFAHYDRLMNSILRVVESKSMREERKRSELRERHLNSVLHAIRGVNRLITKEKDVDKLLAGSCESLVGARGYINAWVVLLDEQDRVIKTVDAGQSKIRETVESGYLDIPCCKEALEKGEVIVSSGQEPYCGDCRFKERRKGIQSIMARLAHGNRRFGVMAVKLPSHIEADEEEQTLFREVVNDIAFALYNIEIAEARAKAQDELSQSRTMLQIVMDNIPQYIFWKDLDSVYLGCNGKFANIAGFSSPQDIIGKTDHDLAWPETAATAYREADKHTIESGKAILNSVEFRTGAEGRQVWVITNKIPLRNSKGEIFGVLGSYQDITEWKETEDALQQKLESISSEKQELEERTTLFSEKLAPVLDRIEDVSGLLSAEYAESLGGSDYLKQIASAVSEIRKIVDDFSHNN